MHAQESTETMTCTMLSNAKLKKKIIKVLGFVFELDTHVPCNSFHLSIVPYEPRHQVDDQRYLQEK